MTISRCITRKSLNLSAILALLWRITSFRQRKSHETPQNSLHTSPSFVCFSFFRLLLLRKIMNDEQFFFSCAMEESEKKKFFSVRMARVLQCNDDLCILCLFLCSSSSWPDSMRKKYVENLLNFSSPKIFAFLQKLVVIISMQFLFEKMEVYDEKERGMKGAWSGMKMYLFGEVLGGFAQSTHKV
jgi:hypothetical protein